MLFIPSLAADRIFASDQAGPALHIRRALAARLDSAIHLLGSRGEPQTLARIAACSVISVCSPQDVLREALSDCRSGPRYPAWEQRNDLAVWTFELSVLACIDRMLVDARPPHPRPSECCITKADLADVLVASIHTGFNGAYVYPQFAFAHELLGAGAWLGVLLRGRSALMPEFVAEVLIDYSAHFKKSWEDAQDPIVRLLAFHAELAGGSERLLRRARKVNKSDRTAIVMGGMRPTARAARPCTWNYPLSRWITEQLLRLGVGHA